MRAPGVASNYPTLAPWQVNLAMRTMGQKLSDSISISDVASMCRLSFCYFVRAFTNTVGIAPYAWFVQQRILSAKALLSETPMPLAQVALECGFSDQAHFTKAFAKASGMTPAKWRRLAKTLEPNGSIGSQTPICNLVNWSGQAHSSPPTMQQAQLDRGQVAQTPFR